MSKWQSLKPRKKNDCRPFLIFIQTHRWSRPKEESFRQVRWLYSERVVSRYCRKCGLKQTRKIITPTL